MPRTTIARLVAAAAVVVTIACSSETSVAPRVSPAANDVRARAQGEYDLSYFLSGPELILLAHVFDPVSGTPASGGAVTFQICVAKGGPTLQMQPLPSASCQQGGTGSWVNLGRLSMSVGCPTYPAGYVCIDFGIAPQFTTVGFRFNYNSQGSNIASGTSNALDYVP